MDGGYNTSPSPLYAQATPTYHNIFAGFVLMVLGGFFSIWLGSWESAVIAVVGAVLYFPLSLSMPGTARVEDLVAPGYTREEVD
ncbi:MAG: hypothetical protein PHP59_07965 [Methanofollis sp.]|uniref:hypothetical protein n=1 Tax=Methanofollis sp. TaxID=2052835 RepID=UPI0026162E5C|nr:hypothetical protein [Methanofollis sp.]MDD4255295.1 hypothetical protein [Methanofollis sp.]